VQVQLTEFASESYPLTIGGRSTDRPAHPAHERAVQGFLDLGDFNLAYQPDGADSIRRIGSRPRQDLRLRESATGITSGACLSIIGMIKPGRTVRLYRQIH